MYLHTPDTPKEKKREYKKKRNNFSLVSDVDVEDSVFLNTELNFLLQPIPFLISLSFIKDITYFSFFFKTKHSFFGYLVVCACEIVQ